jgi:outer membrane protein TolC
LILLSACWANAQVRTLTLREAVALALKQSPDVALARLNERKAAEAVRIARDPFTPKVGVGSGLAYSNGFPLSIEGSAPSIIQAQATQFIFNRRQNHLVAQAKENARGAGIDTATRRDEVALRAALLFLEAERAVRLAQTARRQVASLERVAGTVRLRVEEGLELPVEAKRAALDLARARQRAQALQAEHSYAESSLAALLGLDSSEHIRVQPEDRQPLPVPPSEQASVEAALATSTELRRLESSLLAKGFEIRATRAERLPQVDLVAQYSLLGRFNNYEDFFRKFQRHNGQLGVSFRIPLFAGRAVDAMASRSETEAAQLRLELRGARNRVSLETRRLYQSVRQAETAREVARLDLEIAREQLSLLLAQMEESRASLRQVEEARFQEDEKWIAFRDSYYVEERARLNLLRQTGELLAALQ